MPPPRMNPELMVVGDSLPQGCRSMSVSRDFCEQSWPARLAGSQGWEFVAPDFPRPVLFQLEEEILDHLGLAALLNGPRFDGFAVRFRQNLDAWLANDATSGHVAFDNLAIAGDRIFDLYTQTAANSQAVITDVTVNGTLSALRRIDELHIAINARFVLNPSQDPQFANFTQLDWVRARKPKRLIVHIGHNHGFYAVGSKAVLEDGGITQTDPVGGDYFEQWKKLAEELAALPAEVGTIVVGLLPKIGAVANLRPKGAERENGYAPAYEPVFSISSQTLSGEKLAEIDGTVRDVNAKIQSIVTAAATANGTAGRLKFLNVYELFERYDYKNSRDPARRVEIPNRPTIDNQYLDRTLLLRLTAGGFQSADGMHASGPGYALLASQAMILLGLAHNRDELLQAAFDQDPLLTRRSPNLDAVAGVLGLIRRTGANLGPTFETALATDDFNIGRVINAIQGIFQRH